MILNADSKFKFGMFANINSKITRSLQVNRSLSRFRIIFADKVILLGVCLIL